MRKLSLIFISFVLLFAVSGCNNGNNKSINNLDIPYYIEPETLNPFNLKDIIHKSVTANTIDGLVENDIYGRFIPSLAESWTHNDDYTEWTFKIRRGVYWVDHKGNKTEYVVNSKDFVESMRYIANPDNKLVPKEIRKLIKGLESYYWDIVDIEDGVITDMTRQEVENRFDTEVGIKAIDENTVKYTLEKSTPYFLSYLVTEYFLPMEKAFINEIGIDNYGTSPEKLLYNGPYYLETWEKDEKIILNQNNYYYDKNKIKIERITHRKFDNIQSAFTMFKRSKIDLIDFSGHNIESLKGTKWEENIYKFEPGSTNYWFSLNSVSTNSEFSAFINNKNFRKALYHGLDRAKITELMDPYNPVSSIINNIIPEDIVFYTNGKDYTNHELIKPFKTLGNSVYDKVLALQYFNKAVEELVDEDGNIIGCVDGSVDWGTVAKVDVDCKLPVTMIYTDLNDSNHIRLAELIAQVLTDSLGENNIEVVRGQFEKSRYNEAIVTEYFDMIYDSFSFAYADPSAHIDGLTSWGIVNDGQWNDAVFDNLADAAWLEKNLEKRLDLYAKAEAHYLNETYIIPWRRNGGYSMSKIVPFTQKRGGYGLTRYKYKGMELQVDFVTKEQYENLKIKYNQAITTLVDKN